MKRMNRPIKGASEVPSAFEWLQDDARQLGYQLDVDDNFNITMKPSEKDMPTITVTTKQSEPYVYDASLSFPEINTDTLEFSDSVEYVIKKWMQVAKFMTNLLEFSYDPADYEDDEE